MKGARYESGLPAFATGYYLEVVSALPPCALVDQLPNHDLVGKYVTPVQAGGTRTLRLPDLLEITRYPSAVKEALFRPIQSNDPEPASSRNGPDPIPLHAFRRFRTEVEVC